MSWDELMIFLGGANAFAAVVNAIVGRYGWALYCSVTAVALTLYGIGASV